MEVFEPLCALDRGLRTLRAQQMLVRRNHIWAIVELEPTGEVAKRGLTLGDRTYTYEVELRRGRELRRGTLAEVVGDLPSATALSPRTGCDAVDGTAPEIGDIGERIPCNACGGGGTTGRELACNCTHRHRRRIQPLHPHGPQGPRGPTQADKSSLELDPTDIDDRKEAARRADPKCSTCYGTGIRTGMCWECRGIGWYWNHVQYELLGAHGTATGTFCAADVAAYAREGTDHQGVVDSYKWFRELAGAAVGTTEDGRDLVVSSDATTAPVAVSSIHNPGMERYPTGEFLQWYGRRFGIAAADSGTGTWPPPTKPVVDPTPTLRLTVGVLGTDDELVSDLDEAQAGAVIGFGLTGVATGQRGPGVYLCRDDGSPVREIGCGYRLIDAVLEAIHALRNPGEHSL